MNSFFLANIGILFKIDNPLSPIYLSVDKLAFPLFSKFGFLYNIHFGRYEYEPIILFPVANDEIVR